VRATQARHSNAASRLPAEERSGLLARIVEHPREARSWCPTGPRQDGVSDKQRPDAAARAPVAESAAPTRRARRYPVPRRREDRYNLAWPACEREPDSLVPTKGAQSTDAASRRGERAGEGKSTSGRRRCQRQERWYTPAGDSAAIPRDWIGGQRSSQLPWRLRTRAAGTELPANSAHS